MQVVLSSCSSWLPQIDVMQKLPERVIQRVSHCTFILKIGKWNADAQQEDLSNLPY